MSKLRKDVVARIRAWTFDVALPFWLTHGLDREQGGYVELFDEKGLASASYKRTRVIGRQLYVFSHAALLGHDGARQASDWGYDFLVQYAWMGPDRGWARRLARDGSVVDATPDLYDFAFVLFGLGWRARLTGDDEPIDFALRTLDFIEQRLRHPLGGFLHESPAVGPRLQNPHMHLLEAALALVEARPEEVRFRDLAREIGDLFANRFFQEKSGTLPEYFDEALLPVKGETGRLVEPGHQMEWAWILAQLGRLTLHDHSSIAKRLVQFAEIHGVNPTTGATYNCIDSAGNVVDGGSRTWPNTERIKAAVAMAELFGTDPWPTIHACTQVLFSHYLNDTGGWIDAFDSSGKPTHPSVPASTLYHVFLAFTEVLRLDGAGRMETIKPLG